MAKRILVWHVDHPRGDDDSQGPVFYMDSDYSPGSVRLHARLATSGDLKVDIRQDGVSIFSSEKATLNGGSTLEEDAQDYPLDNDPFIAEESVLSFHIIQTGGAEGITCELELTTLEDEDE